MAEVIIDLRVQGQQQVDKLDTSLQKLDKTTQSTQTNLTSMATRIAAIGAAAVSAAQLYSVAFEKIGKAGFEVNRQTQNLTNSLTMSIAATSANVDSLGKAITVTEKYSMAQAEATEVTKKLLAINAETPHNLEQTVKLYDAMYIGMKKVGASTNDMVEITKKLSIAAGSKMNFEAMISAMDGIATGTVESASEMGRFLASIGLTNEAIKESTNVVDLFLTKLDGFKALDSLDTKISNLQNSWNMLTGALMKAPFDAIESNINGVSAVIDQMNRGLKNTIASLKDVNEITEKSQMLTKYTLLLNEKAEIKNNKFMWDSEQSEAIDKIDGQLGQLSKKIADFNNKGKTKGGLVPNFDSTEIDNLVNNTLDPYSKKLDDINKKWFKNFETMSQNGKDTTALVNAWNKEVNDLYENETSADRNKALSEANRLQKEQESALKETLKAYQDLGSIGMSSYEKKIYDIQLQTQSWIEKGVLANDALAKQKILLDELNQSQLKESTLSDLSYYERKMQLLDDEYAKQVDLTNISYARSILEIESTDKTVKEKESLIAKESELYELTLKRIDAERNTEFQDTMSSFYDDMLQSQIELNQAVFDFGAGYGESANQIGKVSKSLAAMGSLDLKNKKELTALDKKYITQFNKYAGDVEKTKLLEQQYTKDTALLNQQYQTAQMQGYANIAGAMSGMFEQGSKEAATFQVAQTALALVEGTRAILTAGTGDPYTAIPRMAAMAIMVKSLLGNIGVALGMGGSSTSGDSFSMQTANTGMGSTLGDSKKASESLTNAMKTLEGFAQPQYQTLQSMNNYLKNIANAIGGVSSLLVQGSATALGTNYNGGFNTGFSNNLKVDNLINPINSILSKIPVIGQINGIFGNIINSALGGLFGKTSVSQSLKDSGITFADALLGSAIKDFNGSTYQTIETTVSKKSWFKKSTSTSLNTYFAGLDEGINNQFSLVLENLYNTVKESGNALSLSSASLDNSLNNFVVSIGKISLKDKTGEQIQELLTNIFGKIGDDLAATTIPSLGGFQQVGEGLFETLSRVATGIQEASYYIDRLGSSTVNYTDIVNKQGVIGFEALSQSIISLDSSLYGANNGVVQMIDNMNSTTEELYNTYLVFQDIRDVITLTGQSAKNLSNAMILGAGSIDKLKQSANSYFDNFLTDSEQQQALYSQLQKDFSKLNISMPQSVQGFKSLISSIDTSTDSGAKLYGGLLSLSDSFSEVFGTAQEVENQRIELENQRIEQINNNINSITSISQSLTSVIEKLRGASTGTVNTLKDFYTSMQESKRLVLSQDFTALQNSISKTIDLSSVLSDTKNFSSAWEMASQQAIAANEFETMNMTLETEKDILDDIKTNTAITAAALSSVSSNPQQLLQQVQSNQNTTLPTTLNTNNNLNTSTTVSALVDMVQLLKTEIKSMVSVLNAIASSNQEIANSVEL